MSKKKNTNHVQCKFRKGSLGFEQVSWIPEQFAVKGNYVKLKDEAGEWSDGWKIVEVYNTVSSKYILERSKDYRNTRKFSDA